MHVGREIVLSPTITCPRTSWFAQEFSWILLSTANHTDGWFTSLLPQSRFDFSGCSVIFELFSDSAPKTAEKYAVFSLLGVTGLLI